jgi:hypothetical protein
VLLAAGLPRLRRRGLARVVSKICERRQRSCLGWLMGGQAVLLTGFMVAGCLAQPLTGSEAPLVLLAGCLGAAGMGLQNAAGKLALSKLTPHTVMTGNVTSWCWTPPTWPWAQPSPACASACSSCCGRCWPSAAAPSPVRWPYAPGLHRAAAGRAGRGPGGLGRRAGLTPGPVATGWQTAGMHTIDIVLLVLLLGALTGIAARYLRAIPLPLIQIALGAALSWPQHGLHIRLDPTLFALFIPPLLFADGWRIPKREFFSLRRPILRLAFGLVLFTVVGMGC